MRRSSIGWKTCGRPEHRRACAIVPPVDHNAPWPAAGDEAHARKCGRSFQYCRQIQAQQRYARRQAPAVPLGDIQPASWLAEDTTELLKGGNALDWHTHVSCAADDGVVETVVLEAARIGAWPLQIDKRHPPRVPRRHCHSLHRVIA